MDTIDAREQMESSLNDDEIKSPSAAQSSDIRQRRDKTTAKRSLFAAEVILCPAPSPTRSFPSGAGRDPALSPPTVGDLKISIQ